MNPSQIPQLLAEISLADPRVRRDDPTERRGQIKMWAGILCNEADVPYDFAITAVHRHYATSQWPILPAAIATAWRDHRRRTVDRDAERSAPPVDPDNVLDYQRALRARRQAVADGQQPPAAVAALTAAIGRQIPAQPPQDFRDRAGLRPRRPELAVDCPHCHAPAGRPCYGPNGRELRTDTHASRRDTHGATT